MLETYGITIGIPLLPTFFSSSVHAGIKARLETEWWMEWSTGRARKVAGFSSPLPVIPFFLSTDLPWPASDMEGCGWTTCIMYMLLSQSCLVSVCKLGFTPGILWLNSGGLLLNSFPKYAIRGKGRQQQSIKQQKKIFHMQRNCKDKTECHLELLVSLQDRRGYNVVNCFPS